MGKKSFNVKAGDRFDRTQVNNYLHENVGIDCTVTIEDGLSKKRSLSVNALQAAWIKEISDWSGESIIYVRRYVKVNLGIPIVLAGGDEEENEVASMLEWLLNRASFAYLSPARKLKLSHLIPVTSIMSPKQHKEFRAQMQAHYLDAGLQLIVR